MNSRNSITVILCLLSSISASSFLGIPENRYDDQVVSHSAFILGYSEQHEQARWVSYSLTREDLQSANERTDDFREDKDVTTGSAKRSDYYKSGYDRGHLAPAADMKQSWQTMSESFLLSNISPQEPGFNRGVWKRLEYLVRQMAFSNSKIHIVTGPIFQNNHGSIGENEVTVPGYYYKVILDYEDPEFKAIGFIVPHQSSTSALSSYCVSVDRVEEVTGLDFFWELPDDIEFKIESNYDYSAWSEQNIKIPPPSKDVTRGGEKHRCIAITQKGYQCKRNAQADSKYCWQHQIIE